MIRVGYGVDMLKLVPKIPLFLGGIEIPNDRGLDGPQNGDVLSRAMIDAFLGACPFCDPNTIIDEPTFFPSEDPLQRLKYCAKHAKSRNWLVGNIDATILVLRPRLTRYIDRMRSLIAEAVDADPSVITIKERGPEGLGSVGRGESIEARVVILLHEDKAPW